MIKRILIFTLCIILLFAIAFSIHSYVLTAPLSYSLLQVYLYFAITTIIVYAGMEGISDVLPTQAGYAYLVFMLIKLGLFILIFNAQIFDKEQLSKSEKFGLVLPLLLFLTAEATAVAKLLNSK